MTDHVTLTRNQSSDAVAFIVQATADSLEADKRALLANATRQALGYRGGRYRPEQVAEEVYQACGVELHPDVVAAALGRAAATAP
jgi:hypothetical protein